MKMLRIQGKEIRTTLPSVSEKKCSGIEKTKQKLYHSHFEKRKYMKKIFTKQYLYQVCRQCLSTRHHQREREERKILFFFFT